MKTVKLNFMIILVYNANVRRIFEFFWNIVGLNEYLDQMWTL